MQSEFLVMTEKNISAYKLFLSLNIWDFNWFFMWKLQRPPEKSAPLSQQPPLKVGVLSSPPFSNLVGGSTPHPPPLQQKEGGAHYAYPNNVTCNHPSNNSNNYHNQAPSYCYRPYQQSCYIERLESEV